MKRLILGLPIGLSLTLAMACGGGDSNDGGSGGTGGSMGQTAGTSNASGSTSKAGSTGNPSGGSNSGPGGDFSTGLPGDQSLGELTPAEVTQLCDALSDFYSSGSVASDLQEFSCRLGGLFGAAFSQPMTDQEAQAACQMGYDSCQAEPGMSTEECSEPTGACTATVDEFEACMNDSQAYFGMLAEAFPACSEITLQDLEAGEPAEQPMSPASCATLETKCPGGPLPPSTEM